MTTIHQLPGTSLETDLMISYNCMHQQGTRVAQHEHSHPIPTRTSLNTTRNAARIPTRQTGSEIYGFRKHIIIEGIPLVLVWKREVQILRLDYYDGG